MRSAQCDVQQTMQETIKQWLAGSLAELHAEGVIAETAEPWVAPPKHSEHGDYVTNIALALAEHGDLPAREVAQRIIERLPQSEALERVEVAGPGFINFHLKSAAGNSAFSATLNDILERGERYGCSWVEGSPRALVEFVSANPTGPLHVGHGRGAAYGESIAALLEAAGYEVEREYYVNDAGRQADILAVSVWLRYLELGGEEFTEGFRFPQSGYQGDYVWDVAADLRRTRGDVLHRSFAQVQATLSDDGSGSADDEKRMDGLIAAGKRLLGAEDYAAVAAHAVAAILKSIRAELDGFGVHYDRWVSEKSLFESGEVEKAVAILRERGQLYEHDGATWFRSSAFGDGKDRVVVRADSQTTYFASDVAYHLDKFRRGYDLVINIWGADHHGYLPRLRAAIAALGLDVEKLKVILVQFVSLYRDGVKIPMSTRGGEFVTLRELCREVKSDAARFFYVMRKPGQHVDFDLTLAKEESSENPVYYLQYAHARVCNVFRELEKRQLDFSPVSDAASRLTQSREKALMKQLCRYREVLKSAATEMAPHHLLNFLRELAAEFHSYYNDCPFLVEDDDVRNARLVLISAVRRILANGLGLLGVSAPRRM